MNDKNVFNFGGEMGALVRSTDWAKTPLGPIETWPASLQTAVSICLNSRFPMVVWWGEELVLLYNDSWRPILGTKHPQALGKPGQQIWPEIWDIIGTQLKSVLATKEATWSEDFLLLVDRFGYTEEAYFTYSYSPILLENGAVGGAFTAVTETTKRVIGERRLGTLRELAANALQSKSVEDICRVSSETLGKNLYDIPFSLLYLIEGDGKQARLAGTSGIEPGTPASPCLVDLGGKNDLWHLCTIANPGESRIFNDLAMASEFGHLPGGAWNEPSRQALVLPIAQSGQKQKIAGWLVLGIGPRREFDDEYRGFFDLVATNVATAIANARAYEEERKRAEALAELDRAKTIFFSNISHELRTPLTLLLGPLEETLNECKQILPSTARSHLEMAQRNGLRLLKLVNTLLDFSRIEAGRMQALYEPTDLATLTAELASVFRALIEQAGMRLIVECPELPEPIYIDRQMWEKIVFNLLSNAFKFTFNGEIIVRLKWLETSIELEVKDTGVGIAAEEIPLLFERFYRSTESKGRSFEGSGIGLSLVRELVSLHGGTIEVESALDEGSCFTVSLPTGCEHLPQERIANVKSLRANGAETSFFAEEAARWLPQAARRDGGSEADFAPMHSPQPPSLESPEPCTRILLADDNADMRDYIEGLLSKSYEVEAVADGLAALAAIRQRLPDLVLTDAMMPGMDGFELLRELRADPRTRELPIILLSARAGEESRVEGLEAGADDYLIKPFSAGELLARVRANIKMVRLRQEMARGDRLLWQATEKAKADLNLLLSSINDGFSALDRQWRYTYTNDRYARLVGKTKEEMLGNNIWELFPDIVDTDIYCQLHRAMAEQTVVNFEYYYSNWNRWFENHAYPYEGGIAILCTEITERKIAEAALKRSEAKFRRLVEANIFGVAIGDFTGKITYANDYLLETIGYTRQELEAGEIKWLDLTPPEYLDLDWKAAEELHQNGTFKPFEKEYFHKDGRRIPISIGGALLDKSDEGQEQFICFYLDSSESKKTEAALKSQRLLLETILKQAADAVIVCDATGKLLFVNETARSLAMSEPQNMTLDSSPSIWGDILEPDGRPISWENYSMTKALQGEVTTAKQMRLVRPDGSHYDILVSAAPLKNSDDRIIGAVATFMDITARQKAEEAKRASEARFRRIFDCNMVAMGIWTESGYLLEANDAMLDLIGYTRQELDTETLCWISFTPPEYRELDERALEEIRARGFCTPFEKEYFHKSGRRIPILIGAGSFADEPDKGVFFALDLSVDKQAREALRQSEERFRLAARAVAGVIYDWDVQTGKVYRSEGLHRLMGIYPQKAIESRDWWIEQIHPEDRAIIEPFFDPSSSSGNHSLARTEEEDSYDLEYRVRHQDGRWIDVWDRGYLVRNENGQLVRVVGFTNDISDRKRNEEQKELLLEQEQAAREAAEAANRIKDEFLAILSHELRSPLNPILGWAQLLRKAKIDEKTWKNGLETIERNAKLQTKLIDDLLDVSRILRGKMSLNVMPVELKDITEQALETVRLAAEAKGIEISTHLDSRVGKVAGDPARLQQIVWNLLSNAVKFTPNGGRVEVCLERVDTCARIQVRDTGKGISPEFLPHVFDYFRQEDAKTNRQFGGLGLGLAIVRHLSEIHGGSVQADSPGEGMGATFTVRLPILSKKAEEIDAESDDSLIFALPFPLQGMRILVVDDEADMRELAVAILEECRAIVAVAASGAEALINIDRFKPDILLSDIGMPEMDGYMLLHRIRSLPPERGGAIPAIALSAYAGEYDRKRALQAGFQQHISKPVEPEVLIRAIAREHSAKSNTQPAYKSATIGARKINDS